jgi:hypothetical protein
MASIAPATFLHHTTRYASDSAGRTNADLRLVIYQEDDGRPGGLAVTG